MNAKPPITLRPKQASQYLSEVHNLSYKPSTLAKLRCKGQGPIYRKTKRSISYEIKELDKWVYERTIICRSTAESTIKSCPTLCQDPNVWRDLASEILENPVK